MSAEQAAAITLAWASGAKYYDACLAAGLSREAAKRMRADPDWMAAHDKARAAFVASKVARISAHGQDDWKADAWLLERILPERFGKRDTKDVNVKVTALPFQSMLTGEVIDVKPESVETAGPTEPEGEDGDE